MYTVKSDYRKFYECSTTPRRIANFLDAVKIVPQHQQDTRDFKHSWCLNT